MYVKRDNKRLFIISLTLIALMLCLSLLWASHSPQPEHDTNSGHQEGISTEQHDASGNGDAVVHYSEITPGGSARTSIPMWLFVIPLIGGFIIAFLPDEKPDERMGGVLLILFTGITFAISLFLYAPVIKNGVFYSIPFLTQFGFDLTFKIDPISMTLVIFTCLIWFIVAIFSKSYLEVEKNARRYNVANCCCLAVTLGAFMAGDFFTLYIFYEAILLFLYLMIIHREDAPALSASKVYLYLGVATGLLLLYGIFLLYHVTGTVEIKSLGTVLASVPLWARYCIGALLLIGFGGKAGVFLEHIWMPSSYGSAPCLTAALSSGIMIEVGAYGIFRTANMILAPLGVPAASPLWKFPMALPWTDITHIGHLLIWLGIATMLFGALNALVSNHSLKLLAYSSVSQMGYIIMGIGCATYMGTQGAMGLAGSCYHIINHAVFKTALFLCVGAVFFRTKETDIRNLGGLWRSMPLTAFVMFVSLCAISGIPGFNGFASKTMLHHAILEAYEHSIVVLGRPDKWLMVAEWIFIITAGCTFAYTTKLFSFIFLGKRSKKYEHIAPPPPSMHIALGTLAGFSLFMGFFPNWLLEHFIGPMLSYFGFNPGSHAYHLIYNIHAHGGPRSTIPLLYNPVTKAFFSSHEVVHNLAGGSSAILIGGIILILGLTFGLFTYKAPETYGVEQYYRKAFTGFLLLCASVYKSLVYAAEYAIAKTMVYFWIPPLRMEGIITSRFGNVAIDEKRIWDYISKLEENYEKIEPAKKALFEHVSKFDMKYNQAIEKALQEKGVFQHITKVDEKLSKSMDTAFGKGLLNTISSVDERLSGSVDKVIGEKGVFDRVKSADTIYDDMVDRVIFSRIFWGVVARRDSGALTSNVLRKFINLEKNYDTMMEKVLFGMIGSEDLSKIKLEKKDFSKSWFLNICKKVARIHTGDISNYISWIAIALTVIVVVMVGIPYLRTLFAIILAITLTIFATFALALFFL